MKTGSRHYGPLHTQGQSMTPRPPSKTLNCIYDLFSESSSTMASQLTNHSPNKYQQHSTCQAPNRSNQTSNPVSSPEDGAEKGVGRKALGQPAGTLSRLSTSPCAQGATVLLPLLPNENPPSFPFVFFLKLKCW